MRDFILDVLRRQCDPDGLEHFRESPEGTVWERAESIRDKLKSEFPGFNVVVAAAGDVLTTNPIVGVMLKQGTYLAMYKFYWLEWTDKVPNAHNAATEQTAALLHEFRQGVLGKLADQRKVSIAATHFDNAFAMLRDSIPRELQ